jgi:thiol-disulfide isomerase/thioredoxin
MKKIYSFSTLILFIILTISLEANELKFNKVKPIENDTLFFTYSLKTMFKQSDSLFAFLYLFNKNSNVPELANITLKKYAKDTLKGSFVIPKNTLFGLIKVGDRYDFDTKEGEYWDFLVYNDSKMVKQGGYFKSGFSYLGSFPKNCSRNPSFEKAISNFEKELTLYPDNIKVKIALLSLQYETFKIQKTEYEDRLKRIISSTNINYQSEDDITAITKALRTLGNKEKALDIELKFAKDFPNSKLAEDHDFETLSKIEKFDSFVDKSLSFLRKHPASEYNERVYLALIKSYLQTKKYPEIHALLNLPATPPEVLYQFAENLTFNNSFDLSLTESEKKSEALAYIDSAISKLNIKLVINQSLNSSIDAINNINNMILDILYLKYRITLDNSIIYQVFRDYNIRSINNTLLKIIADVFYLNANYNDYLTLNEYCYIYDINASYSDSLNSIVHSKLFPLQAFSDYKSNLDNLAFARKVDQLNFERCSDKLKFPSISTYNDVNLQLSVFQGRILVLYFWNFDCDPCVDYISKLESLYAHYQSSSDVLIYPIILLQKNLEKNTITDFVNKNKLNIPIYTDYLNEAYINYTVTGMPTLMIIDREGNVAYRFNGLSPQENRIDEIIERIDFLKGETDE